MLRRIVDGHISPEEAVRAYHGVLAALKIKPYRSLEDDMKITMQVMSYGTSSQVQVPTLPTSSITATSPVEGKPGTSARTDSRRSTDRTTSVSKTGSPDFGKMTPQERLAYHRDRMRGL